MPPLQRTRLERIAVPNSAAIDTLGLPAPICLGLPDGELSDHEAGWPIS